MQSKDRKDFYNKRKVLFMKLLYFFDNKIKKYMIRGKRCCNPSETGKYEYGISCIRQNDVNIWFYTKNGVTIAIDAGHLNFQGSPARRYRYGPATHPAPYPRKEHR